MKGLAARGFYKEPSKRLGLWTTLVVSNVAWITIVAILGVIVWTTSEFGHLAVARFMQVRSQLGALEEEKAKLVAERDMKIARLLSLQASGPGDIVNLAKTIHEIFETAQSHEQAAFLATTLPDAIRLQINEGVPASAVLAMAIHESGYGTSRLAKQGRNFFGLKAFSNWKGDRMRNMPTRDSGVQTTADFRAFPTIYEGFTGYVQFLRDSGRYDHAFQAHDGVQFVHDVLKGGYCPDSDYLDTVKMLMQRHKLDKLDAYYTSLTARAMEQKIADANQS
jgi:flagellar protein FlgJ